MFVESNLAFGNNCKSCFHKEIEVKVINVKQIKACVFLNEDKFVSK